MAKRKKRYWFIFGITAFLVYVFAAAQPIQKEVVLSPRWLSSLDSGIPVYLDSSTQGEKIPGGFIPFQLGGRYGYFSDDGFYPINQIQKNYVSISDEFYSEYEGFPSSLQINNSDGRDFLEIDDPEGYPFFLDGKIFLLGKGQDTLYSLDERGNTNWIYEFPAPLTCIDSASGFILAGTLDGTIELIDSEGKQFMPPFEPGGSRLTVILGCAISADASRFAIISGIDDQRFLVLERTGDRYRVVYNEFLTSGYRRPVKIFFIENDSRIVFERENGIGIYDIASRNSAKIHLEGELCAFDDNGGGGLLFAVTSIGPINKRLIAIRYPDTIVIEAPFRSESSFLTRRDSHIFAGGDSAIVSLILKEK